MNRWRMTAFALILTALMLVIVDFDRPTAGFIQHSNHALEGVIAEMETALGRPG